MCCMWEWIPGSCPSVECMWIWVPDSCPSVECGHGHLVLSYVGTGTRLGWALGLVDVFSGVPGMALIGSVLGAGVGSG